MSHAAMVAHWSGDSKTGTAVSPSRGRLIRIGSVNMASGSCSSDKVGSAPATVGALVHIASILGLNLAFMHNNPETVAASLRHNEIV